MANTFADKAVRPRPRYWSQVAQGPPAVDAFAEFVLLAFLEIVAAIGIVAAGENVNIRGVGAGKFFVNVEMIAGDGRDGLRSGAGIRFVRVGRSGGGFCGGDISSDGSNVGDGAEENDVVGLQAGAFSWR